VYQAVGGDEGLLRLAIAWHRRVMADEVVSHAFSHGVHPQHSERLAAYWAEALGGPSTYSDTNGDETSVVRMHSGNGQHQEMDRRAIACFDQALTDVGLVENLPLGQVLHDHFAWATTTTMSRYHDSADDVPDGLRIPPLVVGRPPAPARCAWALRAARGGVGAWRAGGGIGEGSRDDVFGSLGGEVGAFGLIPFPFAVPFSQGAGCLGRVVDEVLQGPRADIA